MHDDTPDPTQPAVAVRWLAAVAAPVVVSGVLVATRGEVPATNAALVLVLPVLFAALLGGRRGGIGAAVVATLCFDFFFTRPYYSFTITRRVDVETALVLLVVGVVAGELVVRARRSERRAAERDREVAQIHHVAELAAAAGSAGRLVTVVTDEVVAALRASSGRFERPPYRTALPRLGHGTLTVPGSAETEGQPFGPPDEVALAVTGAGRELGRIVVTFPHGSSTSGLRADDRAFARVLVDQLGATLAAAND